VKKLSFRDKSIAANLIACRSNKGNCSNMSTLAKLGFIASFALIAALPASANMAPPEPAADPAAAPADPATAPADPAATPADPAAAPADPAAAPVDAVPPTDAAPTDAAPADTTAADAPADATAETPAPSGPSGGLIAAIVGGIVVLGGAAYWFMNRKA
jgi:hypothetical protein